MKLNQIVAFCDKEFKKDNPDFEEIRRLWFLRFARLEAKKIKIPKVEAKGKCVSGWKKTGCPFCLEKTEFFIENNFCECLEGVLKQKFLKRFGYGPPVNPKRYLQFARASYSAMVGHRAGGTPRRRRKRKVKPSALVVRVDKNFYKSQNWRELRYQVIKEQGRRCVSCGVEADVVHVDHIKPVSRFPELALEKTNLQVLCPACNLGKLNY